MNNNIATPDHAVIREIVRRQVCGLRGNASESNGTVKLGLVVEGGAMRGVYSGGVLVAMEELGLTDVFDEVYCESAGAVNACYFLAGQGAYGIRIYFENLPSLKFVNPFRLGTIIDVDYAIDVIVKAIKPLDTERVLKSPSHLHVAVTHASTGQSRMVDVKQEDVPLLTLLKATGAVVPLYNRAVEIGGQPYVDGGIGNPIPVQAAIEGGCTHVLVLLTRPPAYTCRQYSAFQRLCLAPLLRGWPQAFVESFYERSGTRYNQARDIAFGKTAIKGGIQIAVINPADDSPPLARITVARKKLSAAMRDAVQRTREVFRDLA
jgi:predicted patatin/cPLA2 family phospholipase